MAQIFSPNHSTFFRLGIVMGVLCIGGLLGIGVAIFRSPYWNGVGIPPEQPVPFSHKHHVEQLGIDCRYCHSSVEKAPFAALPSAKTCMSCHSQMWSNAEVLEPVRDAYRTGQPVPWVRVHRLPEFAYFDHSIHVAKGVACTTCHGPVDHMEMMYQHSTLWMAWCLECHRHPEKYIGARAAVFRSDWIDEHTRNPDAFIAMAKAELPADSTARTADDIRKALVKQRKIPSATRMTECYTCHR